MNIFPLSKLGRTAAMSWLTVCSAVLVFAYAQQQIPGMPVIFTYCLVALTFPLGLPFGALVGISMTWLYTHHGLPYHPFGDLVPTWIMMVFAGYLQWFVLLPIALKRLRR
ncbi:hypothetical protein [Undibacterium sp.]|uniref:hypothetical protein n=1 Tax=Undibacterium sp. TaxID=1914977 RepID=UPI0025F44112|nr:hypothetical protein [Undibacterium sp.]